MRNLFTLLISTICQLHLYSQENVDSTDYHNRDSIVLQVDSIPKNPEIYKLKPGIDIPLTAIGTGWSLYAFTEIYSKEKSSEEDILSLNVNDIPSFDRHGDRKSTRLNSSHSQISYAVFCL